MAVNIKCQKCGADNRLGQLFCRECGAKLDLSKLTPEHVAKSNREGGGGASIGRLLRLVVSLGLLALLGALCWPMPPSGDAPSAQGATVVQGKMSALRGAILRNNEVLEAFPEADVNAHLNARLAGTASGGTGLKLQLRQVRLDLRDGAVEVWTSSKLGPLTITYTAETEIARGADRRLAFTAGQVRIGRVPVPGPVRARVVDQLASMFLLLADEATLLQRLPSVKVADGVLHVATTDAPTP